MAAAPRSGAYRRPPRYVESSDQNQINWRVWVAAGSRSSAIASDRRGHDVVDGASETRILFRRPARQHGDAVGPAKLRLGSRLICRQNRCRVIESPRHQLDGVAARASTQSVPALHPPAKRMVRLSPSGTSGSGTDRYAFAAQKRRSAPHRIGTARQNRRAPLRHRASPEARPASQSHPDPRR